MRTDRATRGLLAATAAAVALPGCGCNDRFLTAEQIATIETLGASARESALAKDLVRRAAIEKAHGSVVPRPDLGACRVEAPEPLPGETCIWSEGDRNAILRDSPYSVVQQADVGSVEGPRYDRIDNAFVNQIEPIIGSIDADPALVQDKIELARLLASDAYLPVDGTLVVDTVVRPRIEGDRFRSGSLAGRFYLWNYADGTILCASDVRAENSDALTVRTYVDPVTMKLAAGESELMCDLYKQALARAVCDLCEDGPPNPLFQMLVPVAPQ